MEENKRKQLIDLVGTDPEQALAAVVLLLGEVLQSQDRVEDKLKEMNHTIDFLLRTRLTAIQEYVSDTYDMIKGGR